MGNVFILPDGKFEWQCLQLYSSSDSYVRNGQLLLMIMFLLNLILPLNIPDSWVYKLYVLYNQVTCGKFPLNSTKREYYTV